MNVMNNETKYPDPNPNKEQCVLCAGMSFYGPFDTESDALDFAETKGIKAFYIRRLTPVYCDEQGSWL